MLSPQMPSHVLRPRWGRVLGRVFLIAPLLALGAACGSDQVPGQTDGGLFVDAALGPDRALAPEGGAESDARFTDVDTGAAQPPGHPLALFFRIGVETAAGRDYGLWSQTYGRLNGFVAKALDEMAPGRSANIADFRRFKQERPDQLVLLHFNGANRDPIFDRNRFFAGHWLHHPAATILAAVPKSIPADGKTTIQVSEVSLFRPGDHLTLCAQGPGNAPDWSTCEETALLSIAGQRGNGSIVVKRAQHGTSARAFAKGALAAAHAVYGPIEDRPNVPLGWVYNLATHGPADATGRKCYQVLAEDLARRFLPGGELAAFDGIEFDVLFFEYLNQERLPKPRRDLDFDGDGAPDPDDAVVGGVNRFGLGVYHFTRLLREALPGKLILADGWSEKQQRSFTQLNGIESEGWPSIGDPEKDETTGEVRWMNDWSGGLNRHAYWATRSATPRLSYINHTFCLPDGRRAVAKDVPWGVHRLVMAAAVLLGAAFSGSAMSLPAAAVDELWDEMVRGTARQRNWLGQPRGPAVHLAAASPDLLGAAGKTLEQRIKGRLAAVDGIDVAWSFPGGVLKLTSSDANASELALRVKNIPVSGPDLVVTLTATADSRPGYPAPIARLAKVQCAPHGTAFSEKDVSLMTWVGNKAFTSTFYFRKAGGLGGAGGSVDLRLWFEGGTPVHIAGLTVHAQRDAMCREFDHGLVLANPGNAAHTFELATLFPGRKLRRLSASAGQDPGTNSGAPVGNQVTVPALDAIFLERVP